MMTAAGPLKETLWTVTDVARRLNVSEHLVYRMSSMDEIPHRKIGRKILRFVPSEIEAWINGSKRSGQKQDGNKRSEE